jgi:hypothetical protein
VAFVRPHDILLQPLDVKVESEDTTLPEPATVRLVSALGPKAWVELAYGRQIIAAELDREHLRELDLRHGGRCAVQLRLPCIFPR